MTSRTFTPGQRVRVVVSPVPERVGMVATVVGLGKASFFDAIDPAWRGMLVVGEAMCVLGAPSIRPEESDCAYPPRFLEPIADDSREKASLADMPEWVRRLVEVKERC